MPSGIDALIANLPTQIQENSLRNVQQQLEQQKLQQNALAIRQQNAGLNALSNIYTNQSNIDPTTGLPKPAAISPLVIADPNMGIEIAKSQAQLQELGARYNDANSRARLTDLAANKAYIDIFQKEVADPTIAYDKELQSQGIAGPERQQMVETRRHELLNQFASANGVPDRVKNAVNIPFDNTWEFRSAAWTKRNEDIAKGWEDKTDYGRNPPVQYSYNKFLNINTDVTHKNPYTPSGVGKPAEANPGALYTDGKQTFARNAYNQFVIPNTNQIYTPQGPITPIATKPQQAKFLPAPLEAEVKKPDGGFELRPVRQQQMPDGSIVTQDGDTGKPIPPDQLGAVRPASAARPRSAATAYITKYMEEHPDATSDEVAGAAAKFAVQQGGARAFLAGGRQGDSVRFIGNVVGSHLPTLEKLSTALENGDTRILNSIKNTVQTQFGWTGALNFDAAKTIVGGEIVKAIQGYAGAEGDRQLVQGQLSTASTPAQLNGVIYTMRSLMAGQLAGLYRQAQTAGVREDQFLSLLPAGAKDMLKNELGIEATQGGTTTPTTVSAVPRVTDAIRTEMRSAPVRTPMANSPTSLTGWVKEQDGSIVPYVRDTPTSVWRPAQ